MKIKITSKELSNVRLKGKIVRDLRKSETWLEMEGDDGSMSFTHAGKQYKDAAYLMFKISAAYSNVLYVRFTTDSNDFDKNTMYIGMMTSFLLGHFYDNISTLIIS